jgi:hypothetical protein
MNCLKITKSVPSFNSNPFSPSLLRSLSPENKRKGFPTQKRQALKEISEKQAQIHCSRARYPPPVMNLPVLAGWDSFFYRFRQGLRMMSGAISIGPRETGWYRPLMQRNQCLEEWILIMFKSCGKKSFTITYPFNSLI